MPEPETVRARRIVATPASLDALPAEHPRLLRIAPDEAIVMGDGDFTVDDVYAIVEDERGLSNIRYSAADFELKVRPHIEWEIPAARPVLAQGLVAAVPCKLRFDAEHVLVICASAVSDELSERLR